MAEALTMYDKFSYQGFWRSPDNSQRRWWGSVSYEPEVGIVLELSIAEGEEPPSLDPSGNVSCLWGEVSDITHHSITLLGSRQIGEQIARKLVVYRYQADYLIAGEVFSSPAQTMFRWMDVSFSSLGGWMRSSSPFLNGTGGIANSLSLKKDQLQAGDYCSLDLFPDNTV